MGPRVSGGKREDTLGRVRDWEILLYICTSILFTYLHIYIGLGKGFGLGTRAGLGFLSLSFLPLFVFVRGRRRPFLSLRGFPLGVFPCWETLPYWP